MVLMFVKLMNGEEEEGEKMTQALAQAHQNKQSGILFFHPIYRL